jgi:hypothetical protein
MAITHHASRIIDASSVKLVDVVFRVSGFRFAHYARDARDNDARGRTSIVIATTCVEDDHDHVYVPTTREIN